jgi:hypothetical protein
MATTTKAGPNRSAQPRKAVAARTATRRSPAQPAKSTGSTGAATSTRAARTAAAKPEERSAAEHYARNPHMAAEKAAHTSRTRVTIPMVGRVNLPPVDELVFMAGIGALAVIGAVEWPIAVVLGAGHALANRRRNRLLREFGEALERV